MRLEDPQGLQNGGSEMTPEQVRQEIERYKVRPGSGSGPRGMGGGSGRIQGSATTSPKPPPASLGWSCPPKTTPGPGDCWVLRFFGGDFSPPSPCKLPASSHQQISGVGFSKECDLSKCSARGRSGGEGVFTWMRAPGPGCGAVLGVGCAVGSAVCPFLMVPLAQELCSAVEQENAALQKEKEETEQRIQQVKNTIELIQENIQQRNPLEDLIQSLQVSARRNCLGLGKVAAGGRARSSAGTGTQQGVCGAAWGGK